MANEKQRYNTKQQALVLSCFADNRDKHYTADEVSDILKPKLVSRATVYRTVERLTDEGLLIKYNFGKGQSACYQFCDSRHCDSTYHFVCTTCKTLEHLHCDLLSELQSHLSEDHALKIDRSLTVFYGTCRRCLEQ